MKKLLAIAILSMFALTHSAFAQEKCLSELKFREDAKSNPQLLINRENLDRQIQQFIADKKTSSHQKTSATPGPATYIIPTVVHIMQYGGSENIGNAQVVDQIRILNEDYRRLNADTTMTPAPFKVLGADCGVEFRLATLDPNGNCTDGITRRYTPLTFNCRDNIKQFDDWPNNMYFNVWVVGSIANLNGSPGDVIGYAQFPGGGADATDGVVVRFDYFGSIGPAGPPAGLGRTLTHEAGHWLSLRHIWGDDAGACTGSDMIADTPNQADWTLSICPAFPRYDACTSTYPGILYSDYMDYTNGNCQNIFTVGQADAIEGTLLSSVSHRSNLWDPANLTATGTEDGVIPVTCNPIADFNPNPRYVCEGSQVQFSDGSWGGKGTSRLWTFTGGTPATDTSANPLITYTSQGVYDVSLTVTNSAGSNTKTLPMQVNVLPVSVTPTVPFNEGFETGIFPFNDWYVANSNGLATWEITSNAASTGTKSLYIHNYGTANDKGPDEFITPALNLTNVTAASMFFDLAFAFKSSTGANTDKLIVSYSSDCGRSWNIRKTYSTTTLATTANAVAVDFVPNSSQWVNESVNLTPLSGQSNARMRFQFIHDAGNNIYIDNININGTITGVDEINSANSTINIFPNPSSSKTYVDFTTVVSGHVKIEVMDARGRTINTYENDMPSGEHQYVMEENLEKGIYLVRLTFGEHSITKKAVIE